MNIILQLLAVAGFGFVASQSSLLGWLRNLLLRIPFFGPRILFPLLDCDFCVGFWSSIALYSILNTVNSLSWRNLVVWALAGGMFNLLFGHVLAVLVARASDAQPSMSASAPSDDKTQDPS